MSTVSLKYGMVFPDTVTSIQRYVDSHHPHLVMMFQGDRIHIQDTDQICVIGGDVLFAQHDEVNYHHGGDKARSLPNPSTSAWQPGHRFIRTEGFLNVMHAVDQHNTPDRNMRYGLKIWDICSFEGAVRKPIGTFASIYQISNSDGLQSIALTHQGIHFSLQTMFNRPAITHCKTLNINDTMKGHATYNKVTMDPGMPDVSVCGRHFSASNSAPLQEERFYTVPPPYYFTPKNLYSDTIHNVVNKFINRDNTDRIGYPEY